MTTLQKTIIGATLAAAIGTGIYEARQAAALRAQVQTLQQQHAPLTEQNQQLRRQRDEATSKLAALRQDNEQLRRDATELANLRGEVARLRSDSRELAQLKAADTNAAQDPTESEMKSWLSRVNQLKQHLEQVPGQKIPELQFVTEQDWLDAARGGLNTEADYRKASSTLRNLGERKFVTALLQPALKQYLEANNRELPTDLSQLQPFFMSPVDDAVLQRWEVMSAERMKSLGFSGDTIISQKAPVDEVYDTRFGIGPNGFSQHRGTPQ
jgi:chromosome segregation ATPase